MFFRSLIHVGINCVMAIKVEVFPISIQVFQVDDSVQTPLCSDYVIALCPE